MRGPPGGEGDSKQSVLHVSVVQQGITFSSAPQAGSSEAATEHVDVSVRTSSQGLVFAPWKIQLPGGCVWEGSRGRIFWRL